MYDFVSKNQLACMFHYSSSKNKSHPSDCKQMINLTAMKININWEDYLVYKNWFNFGILNKLS